MKLKRIIYITRLSIPKKDPRSIQILKNCVALAEQNVEVFLYVKRNRFPNIDSLSRHYGFQIPRCLYIKALPLLLRFSSTLIALFVCLKAIFNRNKTLVYVRDYTLAKYIIKLKLLHHIPVFFEVHGAPRVSNGKIMIVNKESRRRSKPKSIEFVHRNSDGLICTYKEAEEFLIGQSIKTPLVYAWHGTEPEPDFNYSFSARKGIYYTGSFSRTYNLEALVEAMKYVKDEKLILIGGSTRADISRIKSLIERCGVAGKIVLKEYVPPGQLKGYLKLSKAVVTFWSGKKVADYLSLGLPILTSDRASGKKDCLRNGETCIFFQENDPKSLAEAINRILDNPVLAETLARNAYKTAQEYTWQKRAEKIINFIESNIG